MAKKDDKQQEIIHDLSFKPQKRLTLFISLPLKDQAALIHILSKTVKRDIMLHLAPFDLIALLENVDPDEATDLLQLLPPRRRAKIIDQFSDNLKEAVGKLLQFDPDSAAGLMTLDYIQTQSDIKVREVAEKFKLHEQRTGRLPVVLVVEDGKVKGSVPTHKLAFSNPSEKLKDYVRHIPTIKHSANYEEVIDIFKSHPHDKIVVLNDENSPIGILYSDDVLQLMHQQESASLYDFAGISDEESVVDSTKRKVRFRYKWLIINLGTAFLAAFTISLFDQTIAKYVLLAVYMPIVAGMGGNAGTQTLAVVVRGISLKQIDLHTAKTTLKNELGAGFINGVINGILVALVVILLNGDYKIAIVLALAMIFNMLVASFFGVMIPLIMHRLGKDPASSATVFITTATDVLGFLVFLGLGTLILG